MLVEVGERLAFCRLAAIVDGTAALVVQQRRGGAFPKVSDDARLTFDHEEKLIVLRGMLTLGASPDDMQFSVTDGVLLPTRRATTRTRLFVAATVTTADGREARGFTADVSADGIAIRNGEIGEVGDMVGVTLSLPDGNAASGRGSIVRAAGGVTAIHIAAFDGDGRNRLAALIVARQRAVVEADEAA